MREREADMVRVAGHSRELRLPQSFKSEDIRRALKDSEILSEVLENNGEQVLALANDLLQGNTHNAKQRARELGLSEDAFTKKGGGIYALIFLVVLLYATDAY
jgi:hypothetical protein